MSRTVRIGYGCLPSDRLWDVRNSLPKFVKHCLVLRIDLIPPVAQPYKEQIMLTQTYSTSPSSRINCINDTPMERLRFRDFRDLKSGRDEFSGMRHAVLQESFSIADRRQIDESLDDNTDRAKVYRWALRGLELTRNSKSKNGLGSPRQCSFCALRRAAR